MNWRMFWDMYQFSGIPFDLRASKLNNLYTYNCRQANTTLYVFKETVSFTLKTLVLHRIHITKEQFRKKRYIWTIDIGHIYRSCPYCRVYNVPLYNVLTYFKWRQLRTKVQIKGYRRRCFSPNLWLDWYTKRWPY